MWSVNISNKKWYVVQIKPNSYNKAIHNLHQQGFETFLPMLEAKKRKSTRFFNNSLPLFPGYMFVTFDLYKANWYKINSTFGVSKLLNFNGKPEEIPIDFILGLKNLPSSPPVVYMYLILEISCGREFLSFVHL